MPRDFSKYLLLIILDQSVNQKQIYISRMGREPTTAALYIPALEGNER